MKKVFVVALMLLMVSFGVFAQVDLKKLSDNELTTLQQQIKDELAARELEKQKAMLNVTDRIVIPEDFLQFDFNDDASGIVISKIINWKSEWKDKVLEIPSTIQGFPVKILYHDWDSIIQSSYYCEGIFIPDGIELGKNCFRSFKGKFVRLPETLQEIPYEAFANSSIESIVIPASVKVIEECAFKDTSNLKNIIIPENVETIFDGAFRSSGIQSLVLPENVTFGAHDSGYSDKYGIFTNCNNLETIDIPENATYYTNSYKWKNLGDIISGVKIDKNLALRMKLKQIIFEYKSLWSRADG